MQTSGVRASCYSQCLAAAVRGTPQRGIVHSVFNAAANIVFPSSRILSLNAISSPRMPNGLQLSVPAGSFPFSALRVGMPILFGAQRLHIEAINCSLDLSFCPQWNPKIERPKVLDLEVLRENRERVAEYVAKWDGNESTIMMFPVGTLSPIHFWTARPPQNASHEGPSAQTHPPRATTGSMTASPLPQAQQAIEEGQKGKTRCSGTGWSGVVDGPLWVPGWASPETYRAENLSTPAPTKRWRQDGYQLDFSNILHLAKHLCGRGIGLTPTGDDILAGWMAAGWLLHGSEPSFLAACQQIIEIAKRQTHLLSQCWLAYAADGYVAEPIGTLLNAITQEDNAGLEAAMEGVLALGATSGYDSIQGILLSLQSY